MISPHQGAYPASRDLAPVISRPPETLPVVVESVPDELKAQDQWAAWRWERRDGKWTKPPINPATGDYARNNDPDTWGSFEATLWRMRKDHLPGVGFMFHPDDGYAGVDLDNCRDQKTSEIESWAQQIIEELDSYTEASPTGTGLKVFVRGELPPGRRRKGQIEMYDRGRFFTVTGHRLADTPATVNDRQEELPRLHRRVFGPEKAPRHARHCGNAAAGLSLSDSELIHCAMRAANGEKFSRLWAGDRSEYATPGNEGRSESDLALCSLLAFWCGPDEKRIDRLFRQSGLYREKWNVQHYADGRTYGQGVIDKSLDRDEFWASGEAFTLRGRKVYARRRGAVSIG